MPDISRECAAIDLIHCPRCSAPAGSHCANMATTIVWPPHLARMDAYTHRLDPSEDWPLVAAAPQPKDLSYVKNTNAPMTPLLWKQMVHAELARRLHQQHEED